MEVLLQVVLKMHSHCEGCAKDVKDCIMEGIYRCLSVVRTCSNMLNYFW
ncbi:hypothetical protein HanPI659440_Chr04g0168211 [Helianthus annuus]|nr:hypothetical protein HanPI659440_Chr04g0168211 [Helianthus annuus]